MIYFWADPHFNHKGIIERCNRQYLNVDAMNEGLIDRWNTTVRKSSDEIYLVGDFGFGKRGKLQPIFDRLRGRKHLVIGNHDEQNEIVLKLGWETIKTRAKIRLDGRRVIADHFPLETWEGSHKGYVHVHGHSHGSLKRKIPRRFDVGVDVFPSGPVPIDLILFWADHQRYDPQDHHGDI